jgi:hypothetical protein
VSIIVIHVAYKEGDYRAAKWIKVCIIYIGVVCSIVSEYSVVSEYNCVYYCMCVCVYVCMYKCICVYV